MNAKRSRCSDAAHESEPAWAPESEAQFPSVPTAGRRWLILLVVSMAGLSLAWLALDSWLTYHESLNRAWQSAERAAVVVEEQAVHALDISDLVTDRMIRLSRQNGLEWFRTEEGHQTLQSMMLGMVPQIGSIWILDADLNAVATSLEQDVARDSFADRPYFQRVRDGAEITIGGFTFGRVSGVWFFSYNRRMTANGRFLGVAQTSIIARPFGDIYQALQLGEDAHTGIYTDDGDVVLYWPWTKESLPSGLDVRNVTERSGRFESHNESGEPTLTAFRRIDRLPLIITASVSRARALAPFHERFLRTIALVSVGLVMLVGLTWATLRAQDRERQSASRTRKILDNLFTFVGVLEPDGTLVDVNLAPLRSGGLAPDDVLGRKFWDCYWWSYDPDVQARLKDAVERVARGEIVRYDVPFRTAEDGRRMMDFQMAPLRNGEGRITQLIPSGSDITARVDGERRQQLLMEELDHRVKNIIAVVQGLARFSFPNDRSRVEAFAGRLRALANAHDLLNASIGEQVELGSLVVGAIPDFPEERFRTRGPLVRVPTKLAQSLGLALHELATNAMKYGAWSVLEGRVDVEWDVTSDPPAKVELRWVESGGPEVRRPTRRGFGSVFCQRMLVQEGGKVDIDYAPQGVQATIVLPLP